MALFDLEAWECDYLRASPLAELPLHFSRERLTGSNLGEAAGAEVVSVFIYSRLDAAILEQLAGLRLIATRSVDTTTR